jgi:hypothetical protein
VVGQLEEDIPKDITRGNEEEQSCHPERQNISMPGHGTDVVNGRSTTVPSEFKTKPTNQMFEQNECLCKHLFQSHS